MPLSTCASCGGSHRCSEADCANAIQMEDSAQLVAVCPPGSENIYQYLRRQMPLSLEGNVTMVMELPDAVEPPTCDHSKGKNKTKHAQIDAFRDKCGVLTRDELAAALMVPSKEMFGPALQDYVPCVGCRRSMEEMFNRLRDKRHVRVLEPLVITPNSELSVISCALYDYRTLHSVLYGHRTKLNQIIDNLQKNKKNRRCQLHSLDNHKTKQISMWIDVWEVMKKPCREEVTIMLEAGVLLTTENYLQKHRFCTDCKAKVMTAFNILFGDIDPSSEKGYNPALYEGLRLCREERHVHLSTETDFIARIISRAEPDLNGVRRERHAKTIDIAQEEVLTCLGLNLFDKLQKISQKLKAEEQTWDLLFHLGTLRLQKSFEMALESKQGVSLLEQVCEQFSEADRAKREKKEQKKLKKKARKKNKSSSPTGSAKNIDHATSPEVIREAEDRVATPDRSKESICQCVENGDINENHSTVECSACSLDHGGEAGDYSSGVECGEDCGHSSREGSEVACSDHICNHDCQNDDSMQGDDGDQCQAVDEICTDCEECQGDGRRGGGVLRGRAKKCSGGQPLPSTNYTRSGVPDDSGGNRQVQRICQCANEDQLREAVGWTNRLQDMLNEPESPPADNEEAHISREDIENFHANRISLLRERQELRARILQRYHNRFNGRDCVVDNCFRQLSIAAE